MADGQTTEKKRPFGLERLDYESNRSVIRLRGSLTIDDAGTIWADTRELVEAAKGRKRIDFDFAGVDRIDGATMAVLLALRTTHLISQSIESRLVGAKGAVADILALYKGDETECIQSAPAGEGLFTQIGRATAEVAKELQLLFAFVGALTLAVGQAIRRPLSVYWRDLPKLMNRAGADGLPIVLLINFIMGAIICAQGAAQMKQFGADVMVARVVSISITTELGPLMTAIVVAGRSGAAFSAELGTMSVSEEVDALHSMGFDPLKFLVIPRIVALIIVLPLLTVLADLVAVLVGGLLVGVAQTDLTVTLFVNDVIEYTTMWHVGQGLLKSLFFAAAVAIVSCQQGLATTGGAQGVGRRTTSSVVSSLLAIIVIDAAFTGVFMVYDL